MLINFEYDILSRQIMKAGGKIYGNNKAELNGKSM